MTPVTATTRITAEEFCDWVHRPENSDKWFELVRGEVIELPGLPHLTVGAHPHGVVCMNVGRILANYTFARGRGYVTCNDSGVILERDPDTVRGPDVALYEDASSFRELHPKYGEVPPRVAVEILSPDDRANRIISKINDFLRGGVELVWIVDPELRQVTVYRPDRAPAVVKDAEVLEDSAVLPDFRCSVAELFWLPGDSSGASK